MRPVILLFELVLITVTIIADAEPVPVPRPLITKEEAIGFIKKQLKDNIIQPAKKQILPIVKAITGSFAEGVKNATSIAILKGRDAFVRMRQANAEANASEGVEDAKYSTYDDTYTND